MPCLLNIWGVMLFLRLTWVIGQAGIIQGLLLMTIANVVTFLTALSMSAVCTNGQIKENFNKNIFNWGVNIFIFIYFLYFILVN